MSFFHRAADLGRTPVEDTAVDGDGAVAGHRKPSLDLLQVHPPVLGRP
ncbi:hypothetical protein OG331_49555 [Streptomyces sp. NBC_01017]|uniref:Uncharacterized protein n=1 Tax=Streptomyces sp. NBC_00180 TaxID=2903632 RepID=A0AAU1IBQ5_9ACTN|nr:hypothetical protein OG331_02420 [Streptomyces sp. NBC_01017]WSV35034.1 hypothetical protein OG331_49555 [Streptomyces sp. NBC_01017]